jgi:group I intron endonuclease
MLYQRNIGRRGKVNTKVSDKSIQIFHKRNKRAVNRAIHLPVDFKLSEKAFDLLMKLTKDQPLKFEELPLSKEGKVYFQNMLGVTKRGFNNKAGVYLFLNKITGESYVGEWLYFLLRNRVNVVLRITLSSYFVLNVTKYIWLFGRWLLDYIVDKKNNLPLDLIPKRRQRVPYYSSIRLYSTRSASSLTHILDEGGKNKRSEQTPQILIKSSSDFWKLVKSTDLLNKNNPFLIANTFLKNYPDKDLAKANIDYEVITSILNSIPKFKLSRSEYDALTLIQPIKFDLPIDDKSSDYFKEIIGSRKSRGVSKPGVYVFINKMSGCCYVGSTVSLADRLHAGYFSSTKKNRNIDLVLREEGLDKFTLELYPLPASLIDNLNQEAIKGEDLQAPRSDNLYLSDDLILRGKNLVLALEQYLILLLNPEYNTLKVASSSAGAVLPQRYKLSYFYDEVKKELIYISESRTKLAKLLNISASHLPSLKYDKNNSKLYFNRFFYCDDKLSEKEYTTNLISDEALTTLIKEWKDKCFNSKVTPNLKSKQIKLIDTETNEITIFPSINATVRHIRGLDEKFSKVSSSVISSCLAKGNLYKGVFKITFLSAEE